MCAPGHQFVNSENEEMIVEVKATYDLRSHRRWEQVNIIVGSYVPVKEMSINDNVK